MTTLYWAKARGWDVHALTFRYGQKAQVEVERAAEFTKQLNVPHKVIDLSALAAVYEGVTSLVDEGIEVSSEFTKPIIVPFRNGVFMSVAVAYADSVGAERILYGAHGGDESNYPDCRPGFYKAFEKAAQLGTEREIVIEAPFGGGSKADILLSAVELGVPLDRTWSCYERGPVHCGRCESCRNRRKAFREAGVPDPTQYAE